MPRARRSWPSPSARPGRPCRRHRAARAARRRRPARPVRATRAAARSPARRGPTALPRRARPWDRCAGRGRTRRTGPASRPAMRAAAAVLRTRFTATSAVSSDRDSTSSVTGSRCRGRSTITRSCPRMPASSTADIASAAIDPGPSRPHDRTATPPTCGSAAASDCEPSRPARLDQVGPADAGDLLDAEDHVEAAAERIGVDEEHAQRLAMRPRAPGSPRTSRRPRRPPRRSR